MSCFCIKEQSFDEILEAIDQTDIKSQKILYLHGSESKLSGAKRKILQDYGQVTAPDLDYRKNLRVMETLLQNFQNEKFDVIMGSSMGGFLGYYLAKATGTNALLFNPALPYRSVKQEIPVELLKPNPQNIQIVLGAKDDIIKAADTLKFIADEALEEQFVGIHIRKELGHRIPLPIFEEEVGFFYREF